MNVLPISAFKPYSRIFPPTLIGSFPPGSLFFPFSMSSRSRQVYGDCHDIAINDNTF
jgi:hypothetical protein